MLKPLKLSSEKLLFLSIASFIFISSVALSLTKAHQPAIVIPEKSLMANDNKNYPPIPIKQALDTQPSLSAESVFALDLDSGVSLYEKNPDERLYPASTTKMITALTALDYYKLDDVIKISGIKVEGQKMGLAQGEEITVRDLISGLLIYSANDAAEALAKNYCSPNRVGSISSCGREAFVKEMNMKAAALHLDNSNFVNPSGLDDVGHLSTARDLSRIAMEGMKNDFFRKVVGTKQEMVTSSDGKIKHKLVNLNELLGEVKGVLGIKTGWTENAKENLVTYIERDGRKIVIVLLGSRDRFGDTKNLIDWIFSNYEWKAVKF